MCQLSLNMETSGPVQIFFPFCLSTVQRRETFHIAVHYRVIEWQSNERQINSSNPNVVITLSTTNYL